MLDREKYNIERDLAIKNQMQELSEYFNDFIAKSTDFRNKPLYNPLTEEQIQQIMDIPISNEGRNSREVGDELMNLILESSIVLRHPRLFSFVTSEVSPYSIAGEFLCSLYNPNTCAYMVAPGPVLIEEKLISWAGSRAGFDPEKCGGIFTSGGSLSNLTCMIAAREDKIPGRYDLPRAVAYCSSQCHSSIRKGMRLMGLRNDQIILIDTDDKFRIRTDLLRDKIEESLAKGDIPFLIVGSCGSTNTGSIDPFDELADISEEYNMWLHVDGAYGGSILFSDIYKNLARGIERADSFSWDFHKWSLQTYSCSCLVVQDKNTLLNAFTEHPEYLADILNEEHNDGEDMGIEMSRPARALKLWFTLQAMGTDKIADVIDYSFYNASIAAKRFHEAEEWRIISGPSCGCINVRYEPEAVDSSEYDKLNEEISDEIIDSGYAYIITTVLNGEKCLRMITLNGNTETSDVLNTIDKLIEIGNRLASKHF